MTEPEFLELDVVLFLHDQVLGAYGGVSGMKNDDLLGSALARPVNRLAYAQPGSIDLFDLASAYAFGIAGNHAFNDGNKRTAWGCCVLFLRVNGVGLEVQGPEAVEQMVQLAAKQVDEAGFAAWLRARAV